MPKIQNHFPNLYNDLLQTLSSLNNAYIFLMEDTDTEYDIIFASDITDHTMEIDGTTYGISEALTEVLPDMLNDNHDPWIPKK